MAHGVTAAGRRIYVMGGSAKANAGFGPGLNQLEVLSFDEEGGVEQKWEMRGEMNERRSVGLFSLWKCITAMQIHPFSLPYH